MKLHLGSTLPLKRVTKSQIQKYVNFSRMYITHFLQLSTQQSVTRNLSSLSDMLNVIKH